MGILFRLLMFGGVPWLASSLLPITCQLVLSIGNLLASNAYAQIARAFTCPLKCKNPVRPPAWCGNVHSLRIGLNRAVEVRVMRRQLEKLIRAIVAHRNEVRDQRKMRRETSAEKTPRQRCAIFARI